MDQGEVVASKPTWRKVVDFPLVALVIAMAVIAFAQALPAIVYTVNAGLSGEPKPTMEMVVAALRGPYLIPAAILEIVASVILYKLIVRRLGERPRDDLKLAGAGRELGHGLLAGALIFSLIVGVAAVLGVYHIVGDGSWSSFLSALVTFAIMPGFREELVFRGVMFRFIEEFGGSWAALVITSALFGLAHMGNDNATVFSSFCIAMEAGILLGAVYMLTRSLWMAMGLHAAWNFTQGFIWDVNVSGFDAQGLVTSKLDGPVLLSGGQFGLEASVIALVLATGAGLFYLRKAVHLGHVEQPWWVRRRLARQAATVPSTVEA